MHINLQAVKGGDAFPTTPTAFPGMTMRDYFAAQAMQGFATNPDWSFPEGAIGMAVTAYAWADAMLKEREA
jgi:hypothetical protein